MQHGLHLICEYTHTHTYDAGGQQRGEGFIGVCLTISSVVCLLRSPLATRWRCVFYMYRSIRIRYEYEHVYEYTYIVVFYIVRYENAFISHSSGPEQSREELEELGADWSKGKEGW